MSESTRYWRTLAEHDSALRLVEDARDEFAQLLPLGVDANRKDSGVSRRHFFQIMGLSATAAVAACTRAPVQRIVPILVAPDDVVPGTAAWYASTCAACPSACGILLKVRDGRPIKIEGNAEHPWSLGGVCATGQASLASLYDASRAHGPESKSRTTTWLALDGEIRAGLSRAAAAGQAIYLVTPAGLGPTHEAALARFSRAFPSAKRVLHDSTSDRSAIAAAHSLSHGLRAIPTYHFDRARVIVSVDADFLGTWISPIAFTKQYVTGRDPGRGEMSRHFQLESHLSVTGSNADVRVRVAPSDHASALRALAAKLGVAGVAAPDKLDISAAHLDRIASELRRAGRTGLVVCGAHDLEAHVLTNAINEHLGAYGHTLSLDDATTLPEGLSMDAFVDELTRGNVGAVLLLGVNPVFDHPRGAELATLLKGVSLTLSTSDRRDESAAYVQYLAPDHHPLESWGDAEPVAGLRSLRQPAIGALYDTRPEIESLLMWAGDPKSAYDLLRAQWHAEVTPAAAWEQSLRDGYAKYQRPGLAHAFRPDAARAARPDSAAKVGELELVAFASVAMRDGRFGNNGWLQELPDPMSKITWGNSAALAPDTAAARGLSDGDIVTVSAGDRKVELPIAILPGLHPRAVAIALGYGRTAAGPIGNGVGGNVAPLIGRGPITITPTGRNVTLARTQTHFSLEGRPIVQETSLERLLSGELAEAEVEPATSMWSGHAYPAQRWGMSIDLNACTGCSACLVSCQAENNVPIVGVDEVRRGREMHWIRIDRYYAGGVDEPEVVHQPMLCQHCDNAPCETVCPVVATVHSSDGLNQQVYNRCVGTRYCANNCPTKVRRFNWFDYDHGEPIERMVLNPDVVVRSRGVMEKCSFCVQRIHGAKALAHAEGRPLKDGDVKSACQQSCPANAIVFGDLNDPKSRVSVLAKDARAYRILDETNIQPAVRYLMRVRNRGGEG